MFNVWCLVPLSANPWEKNNLLVYFVYLLISAYVPEGLRIVY